MKPSHRLLAALLLLAAAAGATTPARAQPGERRGFFGMSLSCEECFVERAPGRIAYTRNPAVISAGTTGAAYTGGLRVGDTLVAVNGMPLMSVEGFAAFAEAPAGRAMRITIRRAGESLDVTVVPAANNQAVAAEEYYNARLRVARRQGLDALRRNFRTPMGWIGVMLDCSGCTPTVSTSPRTWVLRSPPAIVSVEADGPAHRAGIRRGDTLLAVDETPITQATAGRTLANLEPGQRVAVTIRRDGRDRTMNLTAEPRSDARSDELAAFEEYRRLRDSLAARRTREAAEVQVAPAVVRMAAGQTVSLTATVYDGDGQPMDMPVQWLSNNINVVEVSPGGVARAVGPGIAIIHASVMGVGSRRSGQTTVVVARGDAPIPAPATPTPGQPRRPPGVIEVRPPMAAGAIDCAEPLINSLNPLRTCWDRPPLPQGRTAMTSPPACGDTRQVRVLLEILENGSVGETRILIPSPCAEQNEAALRHARTLRFQPARRNNEAVRSWLQLSLGTDPKGIPSQP